MFEPLIDYGDVAAHYRRVRAKDPDRKDPAAVAAAVLDDMRAAAQPSVEQLTGDMLDDEQRHGAVVGYEDLPTRYREARKLLPDGTHSEVVVDHIVTAMLDDDEVHRLAAETFLAALPTGSEQAREMAAEAVRAAGRVVEAPDGDDSLPGWHAPGHVRDEFAELVVDRAAWSSPEMWRITGAVYFCGDIMPSGMCGDLDMEEGSTYAQGARVLRQAVTNGRR